MASNREESTKEDSKKKSSNKKQGKNRKSRTNMSSEAGRLMLNDLIRFRETGFHPLVPETYKTEKFWMS